MENTIEHKMPTFIQNVEKKCEGRHLTVDGYAKSGGEEQVLQLSGCYFHFVYS